MKLYLAGPMTGLPEKNYPAFFAAAERLRAAGYAVTNPAALNPPGVTWQRAMRTDIKAMMDCDGIALLPHWGQSRGALAEYDIAMLVGMEARSVDDWLATPLTLIAEAAPRRAPPPGRRDTEPPSPLILPL